jgi:hypothetical protein
LFADALGELVRVAGLDKRDTSSVELGGCEHVGAGGPPAAGVTEPDSPATAEIGLNGSGGSGCSLVLVASIVSRRAQRMFSDLGP